MKAACVRFSGGVCGERNHSVPRALSLFRFCSMGQLFIYEGWVQAIFILLYAVIFVVGVGGNLVVLAVVLGNKHMRTTTNLYLLNLAVADIVMCLGKLKQTDIESFAFYLLSLSQCLDNLRHHKLKPEMYKSL